MAYNKDENFIGFNPVNWYGQVEDRDDPLKMGRLKVRIFGWHSLDKNQAPTELLPWAQAQISLNGPGAYAAPRLNEIVTGYFIDGVAGQTPIVTGVIPGINLELKTTPPGEPKPPEGVVVQAEDTPSIAPLARGVVVNSIIAKTNADVVHVCDISLQVKQVTGWIRVKFGQVVDAIRKGIRAILAALGFDPTGEASAAISFLKKIASYIKFINDIIEEVLNWREIIFEVARLARAIIDWILNLPAKLLELLRDCLSNLYAAIAGGFTEILSLGLGGAGSSASEISSAINDITNGAQLLVQQTTDLASTPTQLVGILTGPADSNSLAKVNEYIASQTTSTTQYTDNNFKKSETRTV
jgi:hypothetical protein